jgi:tetratricopeptide (TPR) repeat protein
MHTGSRSISLLLLGVLLFSCDAPVTSEKELEEKEKGAPASVANTSASSHDQLLLQAIEADRKIKEHPQLNRSTAIMAVKAFTDFAYAFPSDSLAPEYLFKAADISYSALQEYKQSIVYYQTITTKYPDYKKSAFALMRQGMIYDDDIQNGEEKAKSVYEEVIRKYPHTLFAQQAGMLIDQLGKSSQQMIREFEYKNKSSAKPKENKTNAKEKINTVRFVFPSILVSEDAELG